MIQLSIYLGTRNDLKALREAAGPHTAVVVDDVRC